METQHITVVKDHPDFLIVNKPAGIPVQNEDNLTGIMPRLCAQQELPRLWLVHRLDKVTSGLLILAKTSEAASTLSQKFAQRQITKLYLAISRQKPKKKQGTVAGDMRKVRDGKWMLTHDMSNPAVTQFFSFGYIDGLRLVLLRPLTGKTHQIRVMLKSLGSPIMGDQAYGGGKADRTYLHAFGLNFDYRGETFSILHEPDDGALFTPDEGITSYLPDEVWNLTWPKPKSHFIATRSPFDKEPPGDE